MKGNWTLSCHREPIWIFKLASFVAFVGFIPFQVKWNETIQRDDNVDSRVNDLLFFWIKSKWVRHTIGANRKKEKRLVLIITASNKRKEGETDTWSGSIKVSPPLGVPIMSILQAGRSENQFDLSLPSTSGMLTQIFNDKTKKGLDPHTPWDRQA